jgi:hypothetical protein
MAASMIETAIFDDEMGYSLRESLFKPPPTNP